MRQSLHPRDDEKQCILCGRCLEACPLFLATSREELSPRAKHQLVSGMEGGALDSLSAKELASICLGCGRCEAACPQGLCVPDVVAGLRYEHSGMKEWLWKTWMGKGRVLWPALSRLAGLTPHWLPGEARLRGAEAMRPKQRITPWLLLHSTAPQADEPEAVALFPGCLASTVRQDWTRTAKALLGAMGYAQAKEPAWACCGCTLGHAGLLDEQRIARERNILAWREAGRPRIAVFCATCRCGLMAYADDLDLPWEHGEQLAWQQAVTPLASLMRGGRFQVLEEQAPAKVHFHRPCHGGGHGGGHGGKTTGGKGSGGADLALLLEVLGERVSAPDMGQCCGMGGVMQLGSPDLSQAVARSCWGVYDAEAGEQMLTACSGCVVQLAATAPGGVLVGHWLDAVAPADGD